MIKKIKYLIILININGFLFSQTSTKTSFTIELEKAIDFYSVDLFDKAKENLIELLYSGIELVDEAEVRFHLGLCSYFQGDNKSAIIQWEKMAKKYPSHKRTSEVRNFVQSYTSEKEAIWDRNLNIVQFNKELDHSLWFWSPINPNEKFFGDELKDPYVAYRYYNSMYNKHTDPRMRFYILYYKFRLVSGYNNNSYGFKNEIDEMKNLQRYKIVQDAYKRESQEILNTLEKLLNEIDDHSSSYKNKLIQTNYLWALKLSGSELFTANVKVNDESKIIFEKVIELTSTNETDIYRTFSKHWLKIR